MIKNRLEKLRKLMSEKGVKTYIIPGTDPHGSEYLPELWKRREWLSGFDGSAGDLVVSMDSAGLWTDSRYFIQAEKQLEDTGITLFKLRQPETPELFDWVESTLNEGEVAAVDPLLTSYGEFRILENRFRAKGLVLRGLEENLVDLIREDTPSMPMEPIVTLDIEFAGVTAADKLENLRNAFRSRGADSIVLTQLDDISWLFNVRSCDVMYNPVVISYAWVTVDRAVLYVEAGKVTDEVKKHAEENSFELRDYGLFIKDLKEGYCESSALMINEGAVSYCVRGSVSAGKVINSESPVVYMKAVKNAAELECFRKAHVADGVAMVRFIKWLKEIADIETVTELDASDKLEEFRQMGEEYRGKSFSTISAFGPNGAIVHYEATEAENAQFKKDQLYLIDSGGQYNGALTDITRTLLTGTPSANMKKHYTLVLKGMINLSAAAFPADTSGVRLDTLARSPLWEHGINYMHGTGHGVGAGLSVHESPPSISFYGPSHRLIKAGMVNSIEPGIYLEGEYGIRLENIVQAVKDEAISSESSEYLRFDYFTLCPFEKELIDVTLLSERDRAYINKYHSEVYRILKEHLSDEEKEWLRRATEEI